MCRPFKWDYVTEAGEILILVFALQLAYATRNATTQFRERQFLVASILIEFVTSATFYVVRAWYLIDFSPATLFLALFIRSQLTNTITLGLIFLPKLWYQHKQVSSRRIIYLPKGILNVKCSVFRVTNLLVDIIVVELGIQALMRTFVWAIRSWGISRLLK